MQRFPDSPTSGVLSIFLPAGYPDAGMCVQAIDALGRFGVDMIELGMPYSDPLADGPVIQQANTQALKAGMTVSGYFDLVRKVRDRLRCPLLFMGYFNSVFRYGVERFLESCRKTGIDSLIIPDLNIEYYLEHFADLFVQYDLGLNFMICPTSDERSVRTADRQSHLFVYQVARSSVTGASDQVPDSSLAFMQRIDNMKFVHPRLIGFGIRDHSTFRTACDHSAGAIVGTAFIDVLTRPGRLDKNIAHFIREIRHGEDYHSNQTQGQ